MNKEITELLKKINKRVGWILFFVIIIALGISALIP